MLATATATGQAAPQLWRREGNRIILTLHEGQDATWASLRRLIFMLAGTQGGKALPMNTPIPTPKGFREMGSLRVGDEVYGQDGRPCVVTFVTPTQYEHEMCRVTFDDGSSIVADMNHRWLTQNARQRKNAARREVRPDEGFSVRTTREIRDTLIVTARDGKARRNHSIDLPEPVQYPQGDLPIPPYTLGAWLGDGTSTGSGMTSADPEVMERIRSEGVPVGIGRERANQGRALTYYLAASKAERTRGEDGRYLSDGLVPKLRELGVLGDKHIPESYLTASVHQRLVLLQGLMDTDGFIAEDGRCEFTSTNERLAKNVLELARSLGIKARIGQGWTTYNGKDCGAKYRVGFMTTMPVCSLRRKAERLPTAIRPDTRRRFVATVEPVNTTPCRCIAVDGPHHLYLVGRDYVPTHNTSFGPWWLNREINHCGPGDYLAVTSTFDLFKLKMLPEMRSVFEFALGIGRYWAGDKVMELRDPATGEFWAKTQNDPMWARIILRSAAAPGGLEAATAKGAWLDEVGQDDFRVEAWEAVLRRLSLNQGRVLGTTTLYNLGWLKTQIFDPWKAGAKHIDVIQFASVANPAFPREEFEQARLRLPAWKFSMFYEGDYARPASLIYKAYEDRTHMVQPFPIPDNWRCFVGIDYGAINNALIWVAEDPEPDLRGELSYYIIDDPLRGNKSTREHVWAALKHDHADQVDGWWGGAPSEQQERWDWAQAGIRVQRPPIASVEPGIDRVIALFKQQRLFVFSTCTGIRDELGTYGRVLDDSGEPTEQIRNKNDFHRLDGLRYVVAGMTRVEKKARSWEL